MKRPDTPARTYSLDELCALVRAAQAHGPLLHPARPRRSARSARPGRLTTRASHLEQLLQIRKWTQAGVSLERIRELLDGAPPPVPPRPRAAGHGRGLEPSGRRGRRRDHARAGPGGTHAGTGARILPGRAGALPEHHQEGLNMDHEAAVLKPITGETMALLGVTAKGSAERPPVRARGRAALPQSVRDQHRGGLHVSAAVRRRPARLRREARRDKHAHRRGGREARGRGAQYEEAIDKGDTAIMLERAGDGLLHRQPRQPDGGRGSDDPLPLRAAAALRARQRAPHGADRHRAALRRSVGGRPAAAPGAGQRSGGRLSVRADARAARRRSPQGRIASPSHPIATARPTTA